MRRRKKYPPLLAGDLPKDTRILHRFFQWERRYGKSKVLFLLGSVFDQGDASRLRFRKSDDNIPLVKVYHMFPEDEEDSVVGYLFRTHPKGRVTATAAYMHVGESSGGRYEPRCGMLGVQAYTGDSDTVLISTAAGDGYLDKVRADIIT